MVADVSPWLAEQDALLFSQFDNQCSAEHIPFKYAHLLVLCLIEQLQLLVHTTKC